MQIEAVQEQTQKPYKTLSLYKKGHLVCRICTSHYNDVLTNEMASQITSLAIVYSTIYSGADQRKHQNSASWKIFPFDDVIMFAMMTELLNGISVIRVMPQLYMYCCRNWSGFFFIRPWRVGVNLTFWISTEICRLISVLPLDDYRFGWNTEYELCWLM